MEQVLTRCAEKAGWIKTDQGWQKPGYDPSQTSKPYIKRGLGLACGFKNIGFSFGAPEQSWATVELQGDADVKKAIVYHAGADCGQGAHTVFAQVAAQALDLPPELVVSDTAFTQTSGSASASRMTFMAGNAIKGAAEKALAMWKNEERPARATYQYRPPKTTPFDPDTGKSEPNFAYGYVAEVAEVEVDVETGQVKLTKVLCVDDVGKAVNPQQVEGQIEGGVVQAAGYTILENFVQKDGIPQSKTLSTYLIPTILDIPDQVVSEILEYPDPIGPYGARGMGEMPYLPLAAAICDAVRHATGSWMNEFPLIPERVLEKLGGLDS